MREIIFCYKRPRNTTIASQSDSSSSLVETQKSKTSSLIRKRRCLPYSSMTQATLLMGAFGFLVIVGISMGCGGGGSGNEGTLARSMYPATRGCTQTDILNLLREASRCIPRSPEGISYYFFIFSYIFYYFHLNM